MLSWKKLFFCFCINIHCALPRMLFRYSRWIFYLCNWNIRKKSAIVFALNTSKLRAKLLHLISCETYVIKLTTIIPRNRRMLKNLQRSVAEWKTALRIKLLIKHTRMSVELCFWFAVCWCDFWGLKSWWNWRMWEVD